MAGVSFSYIIPIFLQIIIGSYNFYSFNISNKNHLSRINVYSNRVIKNNCYENNRISFLYLNFLQILSIFTIKIRFFEFKIILQYYFFFSLLLSSLLILLILLDKTIKVLNQTLYLYPLIQVILFMYYLSENFIDLIISLEIITTCYYFLFLLFINRLNCISIVKYKNLISLYLWSSFFTLIFFIFGIIFLTIKIGVLSFSEIKLLTLKLEEISFFFILISFFWKLGVAGFHFFILELYRFFDIGNLIIFILITFIVNTAIFLFIIYWITIWHFNINKIIYFYIIIQNCILIFQNIEKVNLPTLFVISSINTWTFLILSVLI